MKFAGTKKESINEVEPRAPDGIIIKKLPLPDRLAAMFED